MHQKYGYSPKLNAIGYGGAKNAPSVYWFGYGNNLLQFGTTGVRSKTVTLKMVFLGVSRHATSTMAKMDAFHNTTINHPASSCHWIMYEGVFALDTTIFDGWHNNQHSWVSHVLGKILKHKMMISREGERCWRHPKMFWDHTMVMKRESSVGTERGCLFLLLVPDLVFRQTIHVKCDSGRYLSNQSSNDEARTCPKLAMT